MTIRYVYLAVSDLMAMIDGQSPCLVEDTSIGQHNLALVKVRLRCIRLLPAQTERALSQTPISHCPYQAEAWI